jgi:hypothetical protein
MKRLLIAVLALGLIVPSAVMASEWNMYGSARMDAFYEQYNSKYMGSTSDTDLNFGLAGNARIGAKVKASDSVTGRFEYGSGPNLRLLYGEYHFGSGSILVGQDYTPASLNFISNQVYGGDEDLLAEGAAYIGRKPMLALKLKSGLVVALVTPNADGIANNHVDVTIPKIEASWDMSTDAFSAGVFGGFQTYDEAASMTTTTPATANLVTGVVTPASTTTTYGSKQTVSAYLVGFRGTVNIGPAYVGATGYWGQNIGNYGLWLNNETGAKAQIGAGSVQDSTGYGAAGVVGMKFNDMISAEAGIGYMHNECDAGSGYGKSEGYTMSYYFNAPITLAPGVFFVPEVDYWDLGSGLSNGTYTDAGAKAAYGAKFQINF